MAGQNLLRGENLPLILPRPSRPAPSDLICADPTAMGVPTHWSQLHQRRMQKRQTQGGLRQSRNKRGPSRKKRTSCLTMFQLHQALPSGCAAWQAPAIREKCPYARVQQSRPSAWSPVVFSPRRDFRPLRFNCILPVLSHVQQKKVMFRFAFSG